MTAINFPDIPTVGQSFSAGTRSWIWDGTVWESTTARDFVRTVSPNPPEDPTIGDEWFNSSNGRLYNFYDSYWIEIGASVAGPSSVISAVSPLVYDPETKEISIDQNAITSTIISETEPASPVEGTRWLKSTTWQEFVYYNNEWIELI